MNKMNEQQLEEMFALICDLEKQGCDPEEVALFIGITVEEVEEVNRRILDTEGGKAACRKLILHLVTEGAQVLYTEKAGVNSVIIDSRR